MGLPVVVVHTALVVGPRLIVPQSSGAAMGLVQDDPNGRDGGPHWEGRHLLYNGRDGTRDRPQERGGRHPVPAALGLRASTAHQRPSQDGEPHPSASACERM